MSLRNKQRNGAQHHLNTSTLSRVAKVPTLPHPELRVADLAVLVPVHDLDHLLYLLLLQLAGQRAQHKLDLVRVNAALFIFPKHPAITSLISLDLLTFIFIFPESLFKSILIILLLGKVLHDAAELLEHWTHSYVRKIQMPPTLRSMLPDSFSYLLMMVTISTSVGLWPARLIADWNKTSVTPFVLLCIWS